MKKILYSTFIMLALILSIITACKKENASNDAQDISLAEETALSEESLSDNFIDVAAISTEGDALFSMGSDKTLSTSAIEENTVSGFSCVNVSISPRGDVWPKTVTFDYGTGCTYENVTRKGKITATYTDRFKKPGAKVTITFDGYYVNDTKLEGTTVITNNGKNTAGNFTFTLAVSRAKTINSKGTFTINALKTIEWSRGESTTVASDDIFWISGESYGTDTRGKDFTIKITKPLVKQVACRFLVAGTVEFKSGDHTRVLDYGNGDCDAKATVTINGQSKEITLRK